MIHLQKTTCYDAWSQKVFGTETGVAIYSLNVRLTKTRTLQFRFIKTIGLSTATQDADDTTSQRLSPNYENMKANFRVDTHRLELLLKGQKAKK